MVQGGLKKFQRGLSCKDRYAIRTPVNHYCNFVNTFQYSTFRYFKQLNLKFRKVFASAQNILLALLCVPVHQKYVATKNKCP